MPAHIHIDADMLNDAKSMAYETYKCFLGLPGYYDNTLNSHFVGKLGASILNTIEDYCNLATVFHHVGIGDN